MSKKALLEQPATLPAAPDAKTTSARRPPRNIWFTAGPFAVFLALFALVAIQRAAFLSGGRSMAPKGNKARYTA